MSSGHVLGLDAPTHKERDGKRGWNDPPPVVGTRVTGSSGGRGSNSTSRRAYVTVQDSKSLVAGVSSASSASSATAPPLLLAKEGEGPPPTTNTYAPPPTYPISSSGSNEDTAEVTATTTAAAAAAAPAVIISTVEEITSGLSSLVETCASAGKLNSARVTDIRRKLAVLTEGYSSFPATCQSKVTDLVAALVAGDAMRAQDIHVAIIMQHPGESGAWTVALKRLVAAVKSMS